MSRPGRLSLRSFQRTTPRKKYTVDAFEGIDGLQSSEESGNESGVGSGQEQEQGDESNDDGEDGAAWEAGAESPEPDDDDDNDDVMSGVEELGGALEVDDDDGPSDACERELDDNISLAEEPTGLPHKRASRKRRQNIVRKGEEPTYLRGQPDNYDVYGSRVSRSSRHAYYFGTDADIVIKARDRWGYDVCFPTRKAKADGLGGFTYNAAFQKCIENVDANWSWYAQGIGREAFKRRQTTKALLEEEVGTYIPREQEEHCVVFGPVNSQKLFHLQAGEHVTISAAFVKEVLPGQKWREALPPGYKPGFVLNLGARVQGLDWAPNCSGVQQYLAVSVLPTRDEKRPEHMSSLMPQPKYPSSIQLWEVSAVDKTGVIDVSKPLRLSKVICSTVGDIKTFKWCPIPMNERSMLGLLAFIAGDGAVRVVAVGRPEPGAATSYRHLNTFAFEAKPPDTICTCLTWLSATRIAVGCADGCVAVWDLTKSVTAEGNPRPVIYGSLSATYILSICSAWPAYPHMLMTTSMNGYQTVTDLSRPMPFSPCNTALSQRGRGGHPAMAWHYFAKSAISVEDSGTIRAWPLRRWFGTVGIGRIRSTMMCLATSPCHPSILVGTTSGEVLATSPLRRIVDGGRTSIWQQTWFQHEWRRPTEADSAVVAAEGGTGIERSKVVIGKEGLSRIAEGFKAETANLANRLGPGSTRSSKNGVVYKTIYEEKTAVSALAWNPNIQAGGWAAAGMADGLVRIEDVAA